MLRLKEQRTAPPGGFSVIDRPTGWRAHGWSLRSVGAEWYQEQLRRGKKTTLEICMRDVENFTCNELLKINGWENFVEVTSEWRADEYPALDSFERQLSSPSSQGSLFAVVFPFCSKDALVALKLMKWIAELTPPSERLLVLSHDYQTSPGMVENIANEAKKVFSCIKTCAYSPPTADQWPPTIAFRAAADFMQKLGLSWLWLEADAVPLKPEWLDTLQAAYWNCKKAFAGPIVPDLGHCNGTAIYPCNTPQRIPRALTLTRTAWDVTMKHEMIFDCHDLTPVFFHAWTADNGSFHPYIGGNVPSFPRGSNLINQIHKDAVVFHRCKDGTLIERLQERRLVAA